jgi:mevalonate kinase
MRQVTRASAPGKLILIGEHAVVYGRPALVAALDLRALVEIEHSDEPGVGIELPGVGVSTRVSWDGLVDYASGRAAAWSAFAANPAAAGFAAVRGEDPAHLVKVALGETAAFALDRDGDPRDLAGLPAVTLTLDSDVPIGAGFGSSAAAAVAVVGGLLAHLGLRPERRHVDRLALEVERRQHGLPSGVDHATALGGGVLWARSREGGMDVAAARLEPGPLSRLRVYDSGPPAETTGEVVAAVRDWMERNPGTGASTLDAMERCTRALREQLSRPHEDAAAVLAAMREGQRCLERIGAVPPSVRQVVARVEEAGGAAKISGAGALSGNGAGGFLVYHPDPPRLDEFEFPPGFRRHRVALGAPGLRIDP